MSAGSAIQWTDHTFNPWWGCTEVSPGCDNCYARELAKRFGYGWGVDAPRRTFGPKHWAEPLAWNRAAEKAGVPAKVFCASMADLFDRDAPAGELARLWELIAATPWLTWQLLTKRPQDIGRNLPADWGAGYPNVWLGTSVESEEYAWRVHKLLQVPAALRFLSCEPLLDELYLTRDLLWAPTPCPEGCGCERPEDADVADCACDGPCCFDLDVFNGRSPDIGWVIVGGESGTGARPFDVTWARNLVHRCQMMRVPVFVKQLGAVPAMLPSEWKALAERQGLVWEEADFRGLSLKDSHGGNPDEWPADLRVREFPEMAVPVA